MNNSKLKFSLLISVSLLTSLGITASSYSMDDKQSLETSTPPHHPRKCMAHTPAQQPLKSPVLNNLDKEYLIISIPSPLLTRKPSSTLLTPKSSSLNAKATGLSKDSVGV